MSARREKQFLRDNYLQTIQLIKTYKSLYFPFFVLLYILHEGLSVLKNFMVFVQLLGLASCSFCMFNSLILSISLSFSVFFFIFRQFGQLLCFASCKLSFLSLFLCCLCSSLSFYFFLFLYLSLLFFRSLHCSLWPAHISFSTFLSLY